MIVGIDPGKSGGFAICYKRLRKNDWRTEVVVETHKMPKDEKGIVELINDFKECNEVKCVIEKVSGYIGTKQPGSRAFKFGENFGLLKGAILANGFELIEITPQAWQKSLGLGTRGLRSKTQWKNYLKDCAKKYYPEQKVTLYTADALLILKSFIIN